MDSEDFKVRENKASQDLIELGPRAIPAINDVLSSQPSAEARSRLEDALKKLDAAQFLPKPAAGPASQPASGPAARTAPVTQDEARKIAEAALKLRKIDVSNMDYKGTSLVVLPDGRKFWHVSYGPKQPPPAPNGEVRVIRGGQVIAKVAVDTGEVSVLLGM